MIIHNLSYLTFGPTQLFRFGSPCSVFFPVKYPVAIGAEGYALLGGFLDGFSHVVIYCGKFIYRTLVRAYYVVEINNGGVGKAAMGTGMLGLELSPFTTFALAIGIDLLDYPVAVLEIPLA